MNQLLSRRRFLTRTTLGTAGFLILSRPESVRGAAANEKLNLALVGVGGRGSWFLGTMPGLNTRFAALCDVRVRSPATGAVAGLSHDLVQRPGNREGWSW